MRLIKLAMKGFSSSSFSPTHTDLFIFHKKKFSKKNIYVYLNTPNVHHKRFFYKYNRHGKISF